MKPEKDAPELPLEDGDLQARPAPLFLRKILSALAYAVASVVLMTINKTVLSSYKFPSFEVLGFGQIVITIVVLSTAKASSLVTYPDMSLEVVNKVLPLAFIFVGNLFFGLGGTKKLSLPMFTVLRRFSILFTMIAEYWFLKSKPSLRVQLSVYGMILGSLIAALGDLGFDLVGYIFVLMNDVFTAANGVCMKKILNHKEMGEYGLLFYNSLVVFIPSFLYVTVTGDLQKAYYFSGWTDLLFVLHFATSCAMGFVINYTIILCTSYNSALTTTVIGALKNILTVYIGMGIGGDYLFSWLNFTGLNVSVLAGLFYSYVMFAESEPRRARQGTPVV
ncbi:hypothetical protein RvY_10225 [Ramazzottius varieornatus]|uniref:Sugar phosphate transporter domain-containing protein n=1 Tax=Ramazzottius varieornatus TaxID=947166 RepID=A0A1D1VC35_RAMVA|nr:hypothetical protein RvY_10225 [Ramazzottius varieornatus]